MKLHKLLPLGYAFAIFCAGCGSPTGHVKVSMKTPGAAEAADVETFDVGEAPEKAFKEIAYLSYDGVPGDFLDVIREFKLKARELGADALILNEPVPYTGSTYGSERLMFRATAIAYQEKGARASTGAETGDWSLTAD